ncbi:hypothetical protein [Streptomyces sp. NPDC088733]|uniref:hypothetical protein n=1 Tax=Streptomyces sp. NPDC088733 TaxID=3365880 RepID=UPI003823FC8F
MSTLRERFIATGAIVLALLVLITSVDVGCTAIQALIPSVTAYGIAVVFAALGLPTGLGTILRASKHALAAAVLIALVLWGLARGLWAVIA